MIVIDREEYYPLEAVAVVQGIGSDTAVFYDRKNRNKNYFYLEVRSAAK